MEGGREGGSEGESKDGGSCPPCMLPGGRICVPPKVTLSTPT
jgi:putative hemolysin